MFTSLPNELKWKIYDFIQKTPKKIYTECCSELLDITNFITTFKSNLIYQYSNYIVEVTCNESLECDIKYGELELGFTELHELRQLYNLHNLHDLNDLHDLHDLHDIDDIYKINVITMPLYNVILHKLKKKIYKVPQRIVNKPYIFPFNTNNKVNKTFLDILPLLISLIAFMIFMYYLII